jgi:hypothetical protein
MLKRNSLLTVLLMICAVMVDQLEIIDLCLLKRACCQLAAARRVLLSTQQVLVTESVVDLDNVCH